MISQAGRVWGIIVAVLNDVPEVFVDKKQMPNEWQQEWQNATQHGSNFFGWAFDHIPDTANVKLSVLPGEVMAILAEHCGGSVEDWQELRERWQEYEVEYRRGIKIAHYGSVEIDRSLQEWKVTVKNLMSSENVEEELVLHLQRRICRALLDIGEWQRTGFYPVHRPEVSFWVDAGNTYGTIEDKEETKIGWAALAVYRVQAWEELKRLGEEVQGVKSGAATQLQALFMMLQTATRQEPNTATPKEPKGKGRAQILEMLYGRLSAAGWLPEENGEPKQTEEEFANAILNNSGELWFCGGKSELACFIDTLTENGFWPGFSEIETKLFIISKKGGRVEAFTQGMYNTGRKSPRCPNERNIASGQTGMPKILKAIGKFMDEPERIQKRREELAEYEKRTRSNRSSIPQPCQHRQC